MTDKELSLAIVLRGRISDYKRTRRPQDFLIKPGDRQQAGLTAIASALSGNAGGAIGLAGIIDTKEEADYVEFDLDGKKIEGWLTWSPFNEGDDVEVLVEPNRNEYRIFAIKRTADQVMALHPHCSRGRWAHFKASARWWFVITSGLLIFIISIVSAILFFQNSIGDIFELIFIYFSGAIIGSFIFTAFIAFNISRRFMPFVRLAEAIFEGFGWKDVKNIDLPAVSKKNKQPGDGPGMGKLYFRYSA